MYPLVYVAVAACFCTLFPLSNALTMQKARVLFDINDSCNDDTIGGEEGLDKLLDTVKTGSIVGMRDKWTTFRATKSLEKGKMWNNAHLLFGFRNPEDYPKDE